jgi:uncharacterized protein (DUF302 family)
MAIREISVQRFSIVSSQPFAEVVAAIEAAIGHPDMRELWKNVAAAGSWQEVEDVIHSALGPSGFMEFVRFNHGQFILKERGANAPKILRIVLGNPLIMRQMAEHVPDAGSWAPVTVLVDERADGVHLSYDLMGSYLAPYGNLAALEVARNLDAKVEALLTAAAG